MAGDITGLLLSRWQDGLQDPKKQWRGGPYMTYPAAYTGPGGSVQPGGPPPKHAGFLPARKPPHQQQQVGMKHLEAGLPQEPSHAPPHLQQQQQQQVEPNPLLRSLKGLFGPRPPAHHASQQQGVPTSGQVQVPVAPVGWEQQPAMQDAAHAWQQPQHQQQPELSHHHYQQPSQAPEGGILQPLHHPQPSPPQVQAHSQDVSCCPPIQLPCSPARPLHPSRRSAHVQPSTQPNLETPQQPPQVPPVALTPYNTPGALAAPHAPMAHVNDPLGAMLEAVARTNDLLRRESSARTYGLRALLDYIYDNVDLLGAPGAAKSLAAGGRLTAAGPQGLDPANGRLWILPTGIPRGTGQLLDPSRDVRLATFNVRRLGFRLGNPDDGNKLYQVAITIRSSGASLVALQDVMEPQAVSRLAAMLNLWEEDPGAGGEWRCAVSGPVRVGPQGEAQEFSAFLWREQHQVLTPYKCNLGGQAFATLPALHTSEAGVTGPSRSPFYAFFTVHGRPLLLVNLHLSVRHGGNGRQGHTEMPWVADLVHAAAGAQARHTQQQLAVVLAGTLGSPTALTGSGQQPRRSPDPQGYGLHDQQEGSAAEEAAAWAALQRAGYVPLLPPDTPTQVNAKGGGHGQAADNIWVLTRPYLVASEGAHIQHGSNMVAQPINSSRASVSGAVHQAVAPSSHRLVWGELRITPPANLTNPSDLPDLAPPQPPSHLEGRLPSPDAYTRQHRQQAHVLISPNQGGFGLEREVSAVAARPGSGARDVGLPAVPGRGGSTSPSPMRPMSASSSSSNPSGSGLGGVSSPQPVGRSSPTGTYAQVVAGSSPSALTKPTTAGAAAVSSGSTSPRVLTTSSPPPPSSALRSPSPMSVTTSSRPASSTTAVGSPPTSSHLQGRAPSPAPTARPMTPVTTALGRAPSPSPQASRPALKSSSNY